MGQLDGKIAMVTGGGTGIGAAIVRRFAAEGARVVIVGRRIGPIEALATECDGHALAADVSSEAEVGALMSACAGKFGRLDILVNNAGRGESVAAEPDQLDIDAFDAMFAVNVRSVALCVKHGLKLLGQRPDATIVNMSSMTAVRSLNPRNLVYAATKAAVLSMTKSYAQSLGPVGIRVNAVCPGAVDTGIYVEGVERRARERGLSEDTEYQQMRASSALGRITTADEVAQATLFLASPASSGVTGIGLVVDGGRTFAP